MRLLLMRAEEQDLEHIITAQFSSFRGCGAHDFLSGLETQANITRTHSDALEEYRSDSTVFWVKVVDADSGYCLVGASNWHLYHVYSADHFKAKISQVEEMQSTDVTWFEDQDQKEEALELYKDFFQKVYSTPPEPHLHLSYIFIDPAYQRKGAGKMMLTWGNVLADHLMLPSFLEATPGTEMLYADFGYRLQDRVETKTNHLPVDAVYTLMTRPPSIQYTT